MQEEKEEIFAFLIKINDRLNQVEALHKEKNVSLESQVNSLSFLNSWAEGRVKVLERTVDELRRENTSLSTRLHKAETDREVARKELEVSEEYRRFLEQERDVLDGRVRESDNQRKRMRGSYNELSRKLDDGLKKSKPMLDLQRLLMNASVDP